MRVGTVRFQAAASGSQTVIAPQLGGWTPKAVIVLANGSTEDNSLNTQGYDEGMWFSDGTKTNGFHNWVKANDDAFIDTVGRIFNNNRIWELRDKDDANGADAAAVNAYATFTQFVPGGMEVSIQTGTEQPYMVAIFFAGDDVEAHVDIHTTAGTGDATGIQITAPA